MGNRSRSAKRLDGRGNVAPFAAIAPFLFLERISGIIVLEDLVWNFVKDVEKRYGLIGQVGDGTRIIEIGLRR